jgi:hypothetical protein
MLHFLVDFRRRQGRLGVHFGRPLTTLLLGHKFQALHQN